MSKPATDLRLASFTLDIAGQSAHSPFRLAKILDRVQALVPAVSAIGANFRYFVDLAAELSQAESEQLHALLLSGDTAAPAPGHSQSICVVPRLGTISPWSSKASDIAHACGLAKVRRLERGISYALTAGRALSTEELRKAGRSLVDPMTESLMLATDDASRLFDVHPAARLGTISMLDDGIDALRAADGALGLALSDDELEYLHDNYRKLGRDPTDAELMMFAQANSEHCRHKIFRADWIIDGEAQSEKLFDMIRSTTEATPAGVNSAYSDNAAVIEGWPGKRLMPGASDRVYSYCEEPIHILMKVETHNHPTAISPFPGAATGAGGEIRDEGATGLGAKPKAGLTGFTVSHLRIPGFEQPWELPFGHPARIATPLSIMLEGPIG
ncbi:MAG: phosphoribosylformylglycinamidine synthase, partial [Woeseiaceae bacterium]